MEDRLNAASVIATTRNDAKMAEVIDRYRKSGTMSLKDLGELSDPKARELYWFDPEKGRQLHKVLENPPNHWGYTADQVHSTDLIVGSFWDQGLLTTYSVLEEARDINIPTLIVSGRHDQIITVRHAKELADRVDGSQLAVFERSSHLPHIEEPDAFRDLLLGFLEISRQPDP